MKRVFLVLMLIVIFATACTTNIPEINSDTELEDIYNDLSDEQKDEIIVNLLSEDKYDEAKERLIELYGDNTPSTKAWLRFIDEMYSISCLKIQDGWTWEQDGNYTYIRGRVKNVGDVSISYFKITVEYLDSNGNVLDSSYTNSIQTLRSGNMKEFEIMHKHNEDYADVMIYVSEVKNNY